MDTRLPRGRAERNARRAGCGLRRVRAALRGLAWLCLCLGALPASPAAAFCRLTTESPSPRELCSGAGTPLAWDTGCISFSLTERARQDPPFEQVRDAVDRSFGSWARVACDPGPIALGLRQTEALSRCDVPEHNPRAGNVHSVIFVEDWDARGLPGDAFGLTLIWHSPDSGEIFDADMQLNETMGRFQVCEDRCVVGGVDLENVVTHEAGHFLGLGHSELPSAAMFGQSRLGELGKRQLTQDDVSGICEVFGAGEARCDAGDFAPRGGLQVRCFEPEEGCAVGGGAGGRGAGFALVLLALSLVPLRRRRR